MQEQINVVDTEKKLNQTEIVVILDRSGSMSSIAKATVENFNKFLNEQKNAEGEAFVTLVQFDDRYELNYKSTPIKDVNDLVYGETYQPRGSTALHDAIGKTINELEKTDRDIIMVIITDGEENASREYKGNAIKNIIEQKEKDNWKFVYLGANQDAISVGGAMGMSDKSTLSWATNDNSIGATYAAFSSNTRSYRSAKTASLKSMSVGDEINLNAVMDNLKDELNFTDKQRKESK